MKLSYQLLGVVHALGIKSLIIQIGISLPLYQILLLLPVPIVALILHLLHFVLIFFSHKVRWWLGVIGAVKLCLSIRG